MSENKVWFITGCSTGFGRELAKHLLENNYRVVVTARDVSKIQDLVAINKENALPIALDVTKKEQVTEAVAQAEIPVGDVLLEVVDERVLVARRGLVDEVVEATDLFRAGRHALLREDDVVRNELT